MAWKDLSLKSFLLKKGEKAGLAVAVGLMVVLVGLGLSRAAMSGSPTTTAGEVDALRKSTKNKIDASDPTGSQPVVDPAQLAAVLTFDRVDPSQFPCEVPYILPGSGDDLKRREPLVLAPTEFKSYVVKGAVLGHNLIARDGKIRVQILVDKSFAGQNRTMNGRYGQLLGSAGRGAMGGPMGGGMPGMGEGDSMGMPGGMMPGGGEGMPGMGMEIGSRKAYKDTWVDHKELEQRPDAKLAETLLPTRMVVVSAAFPYKEQWEEFQRKLRRRTLAEVMWMHSSGEAPFQFTGYEIQRQVYRPDGKLDKEWTDFTKDMETSLKWLFVRASNYEVEDDKLMMYTDFGLLNERIVIPRPMLAKQQKYPKEDLKELQETVAALDKLGKDTTPPLASDRQRKISGDFDIFNPIMNAQGFQGVGMYGMEGPGGMGPGEMGPGSKGGIRGQMMPGGPGGAMGPGGMGPGTMRPGGAMGAGMGPGGAMGPGGVMAGMGPGGMRPGMGRGPGDVDNPGGLGGQYDPNFMAEPVLPEKCLVRFIDPTVLPGYSYEYRIRIKMANPNYQKHEDVLAYKSLAKEKDIVAKEWTPVPGRIKVPNDLTFFVVDEKPEKGAALPAGPERIAVQIHRWLDWVVTSATASQLRVPVGDWSIWERVMLHRGEYIGRTKDIEVPIWETTIEDYILARNTSTKKNEVLVDFSTRLGLATLPALLVDFQQGGQVTVPVGGKTVRDEFQWQMLVLTPDGKLVLRNSREDTENKERQDRVKEYREWIKLVKSGRRTTPGQFNNTFDRLNPAMPGGVGPGGAGRGGGS